MGLLAFLSFLSRTSPTTVLGTQRGLRKHLLEGGKHLLPETLTLQTIRVAMETRCALQPLCSTAVPVLSPIKKILFWLVSRWQEPGTSWELGSGAQLCGWGFCLTQQTPPQSI